MVLLDVDVFGVCAHNDLVPVDVDVSLTKRDGFGKYVKACSHEVDIEHAVVADHAEHSLVIVSSLLRVECHNDS